jgi:nucleoside-diphosphate-sugar epimerase
VDESAPLQPVAIAAWRAEHDQAVLDAQSDNLRTVVVRPGTVYGGSDGIVADLFKAATNGLVRVVGDGSNRWPLVYDRDLADLYARLVSRDDARGTFNANDEGDEKVNDIIAAISPYLPHKPDVRHIPIDEARAKMGPIAEALALDQVVRSKRSRAIGWSPSLHSVGGNAARLLEEWRAARG